MRVLSSQVNIYFFLNFQTTELHETKIRKAFVISLRPHDVIFSNQGLTIPSSPLQTFASEDHYVRWKETETSHTRAIVVDRKNIPSFYR